MRAERFASSVSVTENPHKRCWYSILTDSLQRRVRRGQHDGRVHLFKQRHAFPEEFLPCRIFEGARTRFGARVQAGIRPDMADFVRLTRFGLPEADDLGIF